MTGAASAPMARAVSDVPAPSGDARSAGPAGAHELAGGDAASCAASSHRATASRASRHASSALSAPMRAASASSSRRSSRVKSSRVTCRSRSITCWASRAALLMRLISWSQSRAAASVSTFAPRDERNARCAASFASRTDRGSAAASAVSSLRRCSSYSRLVAISRSMASWPATRVRSAIEQRSSASWRASAHGPEVVGASAGVVPAPAPASSTALGRGSSVAPVAPAAITARSSVPAGESSTSGGGSRCGCGRLAGRILRLGGGAGRTSRRGARRVGPRLRPRDARRGGRRRGGDHGGTRRRSRPSPGGRLLLIRDLARDDELLRETRARVLGIDRDAHRRLGEGERPLPAGCGERRGHPRERVRGCRHGRGCKGRTGRLLLRIRPGSGPNGRSLCGGRPDRGCAVILGLDRRQRLRAAHGHGTGGDREADLARAGSGADDHGERDTRRDPEDQAERQEGELRRAHIPPRPRAGRSPMIPPAQRSLPRRLAATCSSRPRERRATSVARTAPALWALPW